MSFHDIVILRLRDSPRIVAVILDETASVGETVYKSITTAADKTAHAETQRSEVGNAAQQGTSSTVHPRHDTFEPNSRHLDEDQDIPHDGKPEFIDKSFEDVDLTNESTPSDKRYSDLCGQIARISISHDGEYATAVCLVAEEPIQGDVGGEAAARQLY